MNHKIIKKVATYCIFICGGQRVKPCVHNLLHATIINLDQPGF